MLRCERRCGHVSICVDCSDSRTHNCVVEWSKQIRPLWFWLWVLVVVVAAWIWPWRPMLFAPAPAPAAAPPAQPAK
jgi:hypothetical protein